MYAKKILRIVSSSLAVAVLATVLVAQEEKANPSDRFAPEIRAFEAADRKQRPPEGAILFTGSSTIRLWKTLARDFSKYQVINRGFGGCEIADCAFYANRIVVPYKPRLIVLRAGGNDIAAGKTPEQVRDAFRAFVETVRAKLPGTRIAYMSIDPTPLRIANMSRESKANQLIKDYIAHGERLDFIDTTAATEDAAGKPRAKLFVSDRLHFNADGYAILTAKMNEFLLQRGIKTRDPGASRGR